MTSKDLIEACDILLELEKEFSGEESRLAEISNERRIKIEEIEHQIFTLKRNEDVDFRVFSPRNTSTVTSEKIKGLEEEKKNYEREKKDADKQLDYYSGKTEKICKVISLLRLELGDDSIEKNLTVKKSRNPFAFLDEMETDSEEVLQEDVQDEDLNESIVLEDSEESPIEKLIKESVSEDAEVLSTVSGVPVDEVERVCHKVEFSEKIINNDRVRAKMELKEIISELKELVRVYS